MGAVVMAEARRNPERAKQLADLLRVRVTRDVDRKDTDGLVAELDQISGQKEADKTEGSPS